MRKVAISLFALSLLGAGSAFAQDGGVDGGPTDAGPTDAGPTDAGPTDAGPTDAGPAPTDAGPTDGGPVGPEACNGLTLQGECNGTVVRYCNEDADTVVTYDCVDFLPNNPATCGEISTAWGFDCIISSGAECSYQNQQGNQVPTFCANDGACITDTVAQTSACVDSAGTDCAADANTGAATNPTCLDTAALFGCGADGRYVGVVCQSGSTCDTGICTGTAIGGVCADGVATCAEGLACVNNACADAPTPSPSADPQPTPDPGGREPDPTPEADPEPACSATDAPDSNVPASLALIALLGAIAIRRRRR